MNISAQSWQDIQIAQPIDPTSVILNAILGSTQGTYTRASNALASNWIATPLAFTGNNTKLVSLDTTDASTQAEATQWTTKHQMGQCCGYCSTYDDENRICTCRSNVG